jgi:hypothetical protein
MAKMFAAEDDMGNAAEDAPAVIAEVVDEVRQEPKIRRAAERFGPVNEILIGGPNANAGGRMHNHGQMMIAGDSLALYGHEKRGTRTEWDPETKKYVDVPAGPWGRSSVGNGDLASVFQTQLEMGDRVLHDKIVGLLKDTPLSVLEPISSYASGGSAAEAMKIAPGERQRRESFAELFATVTHPEYRRDLFPADLHPLLETVEGLVA